MATGHCLWLCPKLPLTCRDYYLWFGAISTSYDPGLFDSECVLWLCVIGWCSFDGVTLQPMEKQSNLMTFQKSGSD